MSGANPYAESNAEVRAFAAAHRYKVHRNEDGELVIRIRGPGGFASLEGPDRWGFYCPHSRPEAAFRTVLQLAKEAAHGKGGEPETPVDRSSECEVYLNCSGAFAALLLARGPWWAKARMKRPAPPHLPPVTPARPGSLAPVAAGERAG